MRWDQTQNQQHAPRTTVRAVFVLDESGSMGHRRDEVINGFNESIQDMRSDPNPVYYLVTLIKFNTETKVVYRDLPLSQVLPLTSYSYQPNGGTALMDAVGQAIHYYNVDQRMVMVTIFTDGEENSSRQYNHQTIKEVIQSRQNVNRWGFVFMGANQDAWSQAASYGVNINNSVNFNNDYKMAYRSSDNARRAYSASACYATMTDTVNTMNNDNLFRSATNVEDLLQKDFLKQKPPVKKDTTATQTP